jgi:hypothetical protein
MTETEKFIETVNKIHNSKYDYSLTEYKKNNIKVKIICPEHGEFEQLPKIHKRGSGCPKCSKNWIGDENYIIDQFNNIHNNYYNYSKMIYENDRTKIIIICPEHGEFKQTPNNHKKGKGCPRCGNEKTSNKQSMGLNNFIEKSNKIHNYKYDYSLTEYLNNYKRINIICPKHGKFKQLPKNHLVGKGCPNCKNSKGNNIVKKYLENNHINFIQEYSFNDCKYEKKLRFDFYLPEKNTCIEYDGKQHFEPIESWGGVEMLEKTIQRDEIKNNYCEKNNIHLIRIPYWRKDDISKILNNI